VSEETDKERDRAALGATIVARIDIQMSGNRIFEASMTFERR
jgi:hypothetical protein